MMISIPAGNYSNRTTTGSICSISCALTGFYVNSTSGGTLVFRDGGASGTAVSGTITPVIGWHFFPASFPTSAHVTIAVAAIDVTFVFNPIR